MLDELASRALRDGSRIVISLSWDGADRFVVKATSDSADDQEVVVSRADAHDCWMHPFSREDWLSYPGTVEVPRIGNAADAYLAHVADMEAING